MRSDKFGSQLYRKSKTWLFYFLWYVCFLNRTRQNSDLAAFTSKIQVFCKPEWTKRGTPMKMNFVNFQIPKWISQANRAQKVDGKNGLICLVSWLDYGPQLWSLKCRKKCIFCKSIKAIYLYPSERPHHALSENSMFYRGLSDSARDTLFVLVFARINFCAFAQKNQFAGEN